MRPDKYFEILAEEADYLDSAAETLDFELRQAAERFRKIVTDENGRYLHSGEIDIAAVSQEFWKLHFKLGVESKTKGMTAVKYRALSRSRTTKVAIRIVKIRDLFKI